MHLRRVALLLGVALSIVSTALAVGLLLRWDDGATASHRIDWGREHSERWSCGGDVDFGMFIDGRRAWVHCRTSDGQGDAIGRVDLDDLSPQMAWPLDADARGQVVGLLPLDDGVVFVLRGGTRPYVDVLTVAIAGDDGWTLAPIELPGPQELLGMAVNDGTLEIVAQRNDPGQPASEPFVWRVARTGEPVSRALDPDALGCEDRCEITAAYLHEDERRWRFIVERSRFEYDALVDVAEDGTHRVIPDVDSSVFDFGDRVATSVLGQSAFMRPVWRLWPDGRIGPAARSSRTSYRRDPEGRLERMPSWSEGARRIHDVDGRIVEITPLVADGSAAAEDTSWDEYRFLAVAERGGPASIVARVRGDRLARGSMVRRGDGYLLIHPTGEHVALDASLRRSDGRGVIDHLSLRGSTCPTCHEPSHAWKLVFVLFGLPLIVAVVLAFAKDRSRMRAFTIGAWTHAALAAWWLRGLWELLG